MTPASNFLNVIKTMNIKLLKYAVVVVGAFAGLSAATSAQTITVHPGLSGCTGSTALSIPAGGGTADFHVCVNTAAPATRSCGVGYRLTASASNGMTITARTLGTAYSDPIQSAGTFLNGTNNALTPSTANAGAVIGDVSTFVAPANGILAASFTLTVPASVPGGTYTIGPLAGALINTAVTTCDGVGATDFAPPATTPLNVVKAAAPVPIAPTASLPGTLSLTAAGTGTQTVNILTQGALTGSLGLACSILLPTNTIAITSNANQTINATPAPGATGAGIGLSCTPAVGVATTATLSCAQTATPAGAALPNLTSTITCPAAPTPVAPTVSALAATTLTGGAGTVPVTVATAGVATASLALGCTIPVTGASNFLVTTGGARTLTAPATVGANAPAVGLSCVPQLSGPVIATLTCTQTATPGGVLASLTAAITCPVAPTAVISAVTAPGAVTLPAYSVGVPSSSTALSFRVAGAAGALACVATGAGYSATPNPLNLVVGTDGIVTVLYTGSTPGTFLGTLVCTSTAPAGGGPFTYNLSTTVSAAPPANNAVPTMGAAGLGLMSLMLIGLAAFQRRRRQL